MLDIPMFTTELGVASLTFSQIPYTKEAYVRIQDTSDPNEFIKECVSFCKAAGAEAVYGTGHPAMESYPFHTSIWQMRGSVAALPESDACLSPVRQETLEKWREIYNERMKSVPNAAWLTKVKLNQLLKDANAYFVRKDEILLGLGILRGNVIEGIVATQKGTGFTVLCALAHSLTAETVEVEVASANIPAVRLYERAGFVKIAELSCWNKIL